MGLSSINSMANIIMASLAIILHVVSRNVCNRFENITVNATISRIASIYNLRLGLVQRSNFSCAEPNANELKFKELSSFRSLDSAHEKFDV